MKDGFIKVAAITPKIRVADPEYNEEQMELLIAEASANGAKIIAFPELSLSGYTCGDLFLQGGLLAECKKQLKTLADFTKDFDCLVFTGLPYEKGGKLYNVAAALHRGLLLALIPKANIPNYSEFYELRHFAPGQAVAEDVDFFGLTVPFGTDIILENDAEVLSFGVAAEICEDAFVPASPSIRHAAAGAHLIVNLSASDELVGKADYRRMLISTISARLAAAYLYSDAGEGESTQDLVFAGHSLIAENGRVISEVKAFDNKILYGDIDIERLQYDRRRMNSFPADNNSCYLRIPFRLNKAETELQEPYPRFPFVPESSDNLENRCEEVFNIQVHGLMKRLSHIGVNSALVGISGGLDSTLALLVTASAFDALKIPRSGITAVTMPCFGTTDRTYNNAVKLIQMTGATFKEVDIKETVRQHFKDIGQDEALHDVTYENSQARERTQVLMDIANQTGGIVIGTGDLSELALGWATYNGDHMSMYGVNGGVPKTLVRHLVHYFSMKFADSGLKETLLDILNTPVSPELLPPKDGVISQQTEDLVGPYELHDYFLYYMLRFGFRPGKIFRLAKLSFKGQYSDEVILKWLKVFYKRFFSQQFKRSCLPDGPKVGSVGVSPRGDLRMPSDASAEVWLREVMGL